MAKELRTVPDGPNFTARERLALIKHTEKHHTVVPLNYARHSRQSLTLVQEF